MRSKMMKRSGRSAVWVFAVAALWAAAGCAPGEPPLDDAAAQQRLERVIAWVDSPAYEQAVSWDEHVVRSYQLAWGREPSAHELRWLTALRDHADLRRSDALGIAMRASGTRTTWDDVHAFRGTADDFHADPVLTATAATVAASARALTVADLIPPAAARPLRQAVPAAPAVVAQAASVTASASATATAYNVYYGYLHAHSSLSDGKGRPDEAYRYARDVAGLDYFALTDHGENMAIFPWLDSWNRLKRAAQQAYQPGRFATLWGFEWSSPVFGHINIVNSNDFTEAVSEFNLEDIYDWLAARPQAFGRYNHPGRIDEFAVEFLELAPFSHVRNQMVGIELFNKDDGFGTTHYTCDYPLCIADSYLDHGNLLGWRIGAQGGQDNHSRDWGTRTEYRVGVLATELTREAIIDAHFQRRMFATEDRNLRLDVRASGQPMGAVLPVATPRTFTVTACDGNGDTFVEARLYRNGRVIDSRATSGSCIDVGFEDPGAAGLPAYYYVTVRQADDQDGDGRGDEAIASPIWFNG